MKKYKGFQYEDGRVTDTAYFHGYNFGDILLEGIFFKANVLKNGELKIEIPKSANIYFKTLNKSYWLKEALSYAKDNDLFDEKDDGSGEQLELI